MGAAALDAVTVHWTQFPAAAIADVDWTDHAAAHRAVMRLFTRRLDGTAGERRDRAGILYRLDNVNGEPTVLVQSTVVPELVPPVCRTVAVSPERWLAGAGRRVAFRLAVNPVRRTTRHFTDATVKDASTSVARAAAAGRPYRKQTATVVPGDELDGWLRAKLDGALGDIEFVNHCRDETRSGPHRIVVDTVDGFATVADEDVLSELRLAGVGREKAFGCGLLTVTTVD